MKDKKTVIGKFTGKCCDAEVVNNNGMFLSTELFETLMASDEYKTAIENGYYIGFLGHPEDPNDMNFKNACIVMTEMNLEENGDVTGSFDLVDTPVGRVVKAFTDAGVRFGISIRGAGDVANDGTVDPDSFVFRGFDLVTFPAYEDCVPEFQAIAASEDVESRKKYKKVCAALKKNLESITSCEALDVLQAQFNENSQEYKDIESQKESLIADEDKELYIQVLEQKVEGLTNIVLEQAQRIKDMGQQCDDLDARLFLSEQNVLCSKRINKRIKDIGDRQNNEMTSRISELESQNSLLTNKVQASDSLTSELKSKNKKLSSVNASLKSKLDDIEKQNLIYQQRVEASEASESEHRKSISSLESELRETVAANKRLERTLSNRGSEVDELKSRIEANEQLILEYQQVYADQCAYAVGVNLDNIPVTASTTPKDLRSFIYSKTSPYLQSSNRKVMSSEDITKQDIEQGTDQDNGLVVL